MESRCTCADCRSKNPQGLLQSNRVKKAHEKKTIINTSQIARRGRGLLQTRQPASGPYGRGSHSQSNNFSMRARGRGTNINYSSRKSQVPSQVTEMPSPLLGLDLDMPMDQDDEYLPAMDVENDDMLVSSPTPTLIVMDSGDLHSSMPDALSDTDKMPVLSPVAADPVVTAVPLIDTPILGLYDDPDDDYDYSAHVEDLEPLHNEQVVALGGPDAGHVESLPTPVHDKDVPLPKDHNPLLAKVVLPPVPPRPPAHEAYMKSHGLWFIRAVLLLAAFLHAKHHVTFRACAILLFGLRLIFLSLGLIAKDDDMPITLNTVIKRLDLQDRFTILPACPKCHRIFPPSISSNSQCPDCNIALFNPKPPTLSQIIHGPSKQSPLLSVPFCPLSSLLVDFLAQPGIEDAVEEWRTDEPSPPGEYNRVMDGRVWKEIPDCNGKPFFDEDSLTEKGELRIGVNISLDWLAFSPIILCVYSLLHGHYRFQATKSAYSASHSSGVMSFTVQNLPPALK
jgi:hypothetical protein